MKKRDIFRNRIIKALKGMGAKPIKILYDGDGFELDTELGRLEVVVPADSEGSKVLTVTSRFDDPTRAYERLRDSVNRFSGKWNFHYFSRGSDPKVVADDCIGSIRMIAKA